MLLGSSGVGKSFIAEILQANFPIQENIHHLHTCQAMADLPDLLTSTCGPSLVVLEDLETADQLRISRLENLLVALRTAGGGGRGQVLVVVTSRQSGDLSLVQRGQNTWL